MDDVIYDDVDYVTTRRETAAAYGVIYTYTTRAQRHAVMNEYKGKLRYIQLVGYIQSSAVVGMQ